MKSDGTNFVIKLQLLNEGELLADREEIAVLFRFLWLSSFGILECVLEGDGQIIVVVHREGLHIEVRSHHGAVERSTSSDALKSVEGSLKFFLLEDLFDDRLNDRSTGTISDKLHKVYLLSSKA